MRAPVPHRRPRLLTLCLLATLALQGCAVVAVADAAITVVATGVKVTAKAVGAVADAVIPDGEDKPKD
jgi:hypothetical protein